MAKIILITGGARSGKSSFALKKAEQIASKKLFVATCPEVDSEMSERVRRHQEERRGRGWKTLEVEYDLAGLFSDNADSFDVILIDCITLWVNNVLFKYENSSLGVDDSMITQLCSEWMEKAAQYDGTVLCVTNEVGAGIVPDNVLARRYRDLVGTCNQYIGKKADEVVLVSCGIPLFLKK